jgi:hypothetical protein
MTRVTTLLLWVALMGLAELAASAPAPEPGPGEFALDRVEITPIPSVGPDGNVVEADFRGRRIMIGAAVLGCPGPVKQGYLVAVVDHVAFILATDPIPVEVKARLAERYAMHTPRGDALYSAYFVIRSAGYFYSTVRYTQEEDLCVVLPTWDAVVQRLKLREGAPKTTSA